MSLAAIDGALFQAYLDLGLGLDTAEENVQFTPPANTAWAEVTINPAGIQTVTLGNSGMDEHVGFMQIAFYAPTKKGRAALLTYAQAVRDGFVHGDGTSGSGWSVRYTSVSRSAVQRSGKWARLVMTVNFEARTIRPEI